MTKATTKVTTKAKNVESSSGTMRYPIGGIVIILITVVAVGWWLETNSTNFDPETVGADSWEKIESDGFATDLWSLPKEALLGFVEIPAGEFLMGSDPSVDPMAYDNERWSVRQKQGRVELPLFYINRYEVTTAQFQRFVRDSGHAFDLDLLPVNPEYPAVNLTWPDALAYCRWLEQELKASTQTPQQILELLNTGWQITLPTEAQWEKAARGSDGRIFPWGDEPTKNLANFASPGITAVGSIPCGDCSYGLADVSGNVWELTRSPYLPYPYNPDAIPDFNSDALFVMRGGSFGDQINNVRAAIRGGVDPGVRNPAIGFRLVLSHD